MKILIFGLGSMGKRRANCLKSLGFHEIYGFDIRIDRLKEAENLGIHAIGDSVEASRKKADAYFICTPPDQHESYINLALKNYIPSFVEASVILGELEDIANKAKQQGLFIAPSCTMIFHPAIKKIKEIIADKIYGKVTNFSYHCGQFLPDWHPWENVLDFYVSKENTGGCREIVPFELTWIVHCLGLPKKIKAHFGKTMHVGADIPDTYAISLDFGNVFGTILIDVVSRYGIRSLILNFEEAQIHWRWDHNHLDIYESEHKKWTKLKLEHNSYHNSSYNPNINEDMYICEISYFFEAMNNPDIFPNSLVKDIQILKLLNQLEG